MKYSDGTFDMTVDDIHEIRENNSKMFENMSKEEVLECIKKGANEFYQSSSEKVAIA